MDFRVPLHRDCRRKNYIVPKPVPCQQPATSPPPREYQCGGLIRRCHGCNNELGTGSI